MSIASPSLRSSPPRPAAKFEELLTCMVALPSTALTVTGMSYPPQDRAGARADGIGGWRGIAEIGEVQIVRHARLLGLLLPGFAASLVFAASWRLLIPWSGRQIVLAHIVRSEQAVLAEYAGNALPGRLGAARGAALAPHHAQIAWTVECRSYSDLVAQSRWQARQHRSNAAASAGAGAPHLRSRRRLGRIPARRRRFRRRPCARNWRQQGDHHAQDQLPTASAASAAMRSASSCVSRKAASQAASNTGYGLGAVIRLLLQPSRTPSA